MLGAPHADIASVMFGSKKKHWKKHVFSNSAFGFPGIGYSTATLATPPSIDKKSAHKIMGIFRNKTKNITFSNSLSVRHMQTSLP